jgi:sRNA-binding protein
MRCAACGAGIAATDSNCPYCGQMTPHGAWQAQAQQHHAHAQAAYEAQREQAEQFERAAAAKRDVQQSATRALYWSLGGLVGCFCFVPSIVAVVLALKARKAAQENEFEVPTSATTALVLGLVGVVMGIGLITIGVVQDQKRSARVEAIEKQLGDSARSSPLAQLTACLLAEKRLLTEGWDGSKTIDEVECDGRLQQTGDRAVLSGLRFEQSQKRIVLAACLQKGERWSVAGFSTIECNEKQYGGAGTEGPRAGSSSTSPSTSPLGSASSASYPRAP